MPKTKDDENKDDELEEPVVNPEDNEEEEDAGKGKGEETRSIEEMLAELSPEARALFEKKNANLMSALHKERDARRNAEKAIADAKKAARTAEIARLKESEDYKKLYEQSEARLAELEPKSDAFDQYETALERTLEASIAEIPEDKRSLIPAKLSVVDQLEWIAANRSLLSKAAPVDLGAGKKGGGSEKTVTLTQEQKDFAKRMNISEDEYAKNLNRTR